jgi:hypothetical protein
MLTGQPSRAFVVASEHGVHDGLVLLTRGLA